jgi:hypothetical protein
MTSPEPRARSPPEAALWGFFFSYLLSGVSGLIGTVIVLI